MWTMSTTTDKKQEMALEAFQKLSAMAKQFQTFNAENDFTAEAEALEKAAQMFFAKAMSFSK